MRFLKQLGLWIVVLAGLVIGGVYVAFVPRLKEAEKEVETIYDRIDEMNKRPSKIFSSEGEILFKSVAENRRLVELQYVPMRVRHAILAAEDKRFYDHAGVDAWALGRVLFTTVKEQRASQGGSTLTMQLAKRLYSSPARTLDRKIKDVAVAMSIEQRLSKDQILELYLNQVYFGEGAYGIVAAADTYFGKKLDQLTIGEAAMLSRCVRRPSDQNPIEDLPGSLQNRNVVLQIMQEEGWITAGEHKVASQEKPKIRKRGSSRNVWVRPGAEYVVDHVISEFRKLVPSADIRRGGYSVQTTINWSIQQRANEAVQSVVKAYRRRGVTTGAMVVMDKDGQLLAEVGGANYKRNQFNAISQGNLQPGSSFKPFIYSVAFQLGKVDPAGTISNERIVIPDGVGPGKDWAPKNFGYAIGGRVAVKTALASSINLPAIHALEEVGPEKFQEYAPDFGIRSPLHSGLSVALGTALVNPLELASGYSVFMLRGNRVDPFIIKRIQGPNNEILVSYIPRRTRTRIDSQVCEATDELLRAVVLQGTGKGAQGIPEARGKTGTTQNGKDAWFAGYAKGLVGVAWVANEQWNPRKKSWEYKAMPSVFGGSVTVQIWSKTMSRAVTKFGSDLTFGPDISVNRKRPLTPEEETVLAERLAEKEESRRIQAFETARELEDAQLAPSVTETDPGSGQPAPEASSENSTAATKPKPAELPPQESQNPPIVPTNPKAKPPSTSPGKERERTPLGDEEVAIEICADTGQRASKYCNETIEKRYRKGREPRTICYLHKGGGASHKHR